MTDDQLAETYAKLQDLFVAVGAKLEDVERFFAHGITEVSLQLCKGNRSKASAHLIKVGYHLAGRLRRADQSEHRIVLPEVLH